MLDESNTCQRRRCALNFNMELPDVHEAKERVSEEGVRVLQETGDQAVYKGQAALRFQLPGHEVSFCSLGIGSAFFNRHHSMVRYEIQWKAMKPLKRWETCN